MLSTVCGMLPQLHALPCPCSILGTWDLVNFSPGVELWYRSVLRQQMWDNVGIVLRTATLRTALEAIHTLADQAHACRGERPATVVRRLELDNLVLIAEAITLAALTWQESRGTHYLIQQLGSSTRSVCPKLSIALDPRESYTAKLS